jgi:hypothetical protein
VLVTVLSSPQSVGSYDLAVLAAIAATDAICGLQLGRYSRGQDHDNAVALLETVDLPDHTLPTKLRRVLGSKDNVHYSRLTTSQYKELGHMIMCRMTRPSGNLQGAGVTGHTLTRTVSDLLRSRRPFRNRNWL